MVGHEFDAVVVGAGFAGMYMLHRLRGRGLPCGCSRPAAGSGGPGIGTAIRGARCDIESMAYSHLFSDELQQGWKWSERYAT